MSTEKKINNISWSCSPLKNKLENFTNGCSGPVCGLPYVKAGYNCNDEEIAIFNKMVSDAKDCCIIPKPKNIESFLSTPIQNINEPLQNINKPLQNINTPLQNINTPVKNINTPVKNINESMQNINNFNQSNYLFASYDSNSHFESNLYNYKLLN